MGFSALPSSLMTGKAVPSSSFVHTLRVDSSFFFLDSRATSPSDCARAAAGQRSASRSSAASALVNAFIALILPGVAAGVEPPGVELFGGGHYNESRKGNAGALGSAAREPVRHRHPAALHLPLPAGFSLRDGDAGRGLAPRPAQPAVAGAGVRLRAVARAGPQLRQRPLRPARALHYPAAHRRPGSARRPAARAAAGDSHRPGGSGGQFRPGALAGGPALARGAGAGLLARALRGGVAGQPLLVEPVHRPVQPAPRLSARRRARAARLAVGADGLRRSHPPRRGRGAVLRPAVRPGRAAAAGNLAGGDWPGGLLGG